MQGTRCRVAAVLSALVIGQATQPCHSGISISISTCQFSSATAIDIFVDAADVEHSSLLLHSHTF